MSNTSLPNRLIGILTLKAPIYREIAEDSGSLTTAAIITVASVLATGIGSAFVSTMLPGAIPADMQTPEIAAALAASANPVLNFLSAVISGLVAWFIGSFAFGFVAKMLGGRTNTGEMLRVLGHVNIVDFLNLIPCMGLVAWILKLVAMIIGIREAAEFDTVKAVITGIIGVVVIWGINFAINAVLGMVFVAIG
jgi:hypothetical protein